MTKINIKRLFIVVLSSGIAILFGDRIFDGAATLYTWVVTAHATLNSVIPITAYVALGWALALAVAIKIRTDKLQNRNYFGYTMLVLIPTYSIWVYNSPWLPPFGGLELIPAIVLGVLGFGATLFIAQLIVLSISGYTLDDMERDRRERIDDPYGDKHAAKVLDDE